MVKSITPVDIIELLANQEYKIALLYKEFSQQFPFYKDLWNGMVKDELEHQKLILSFRRQIVQGKIYFNAMMLRVENIKKHIEFIEGLIEKTTAGDLSLKDALKSAIQIESSMIDQDFFVFFTGDSEALNQGLEKLTNETNKHFNKLYEIAENQKIF